MVVLYRSCHAECRCRRCIEARVSVEINAVPGRQRAAPRYERDAISRGERGREGSGPSSSYSMCEPRLLPAWLRPAARGCAQWIFRPWVSWITTPQIFAAIGVAARPEAAQILSHGDGSDRKSVGKGKRITV